MKKNKILNFKVSEILMHLDKDFTELNKWGAKKIIKFTFKTNSNC